jgi:hypothetical protein
VELLKENLEIMTRLGIQLRMKKLSIKEKEILPSQLEAESQLPPALLSSSFQEFIEEEEL